MPLRTSLANDGGTGKTPRQGRGQTITPRCRTKLTTAEMKHYAMRRAIRASLCLGVAVLLVAAFPRFNELAAPPPRPCATVRDSAGRPLEVLCFDAQRRLVSHTYVDTAGLRVALPVRVDRPPHFGQRPGALQEYLRMRSPWPGNVDIVGHVLLTVLIGADGRVQDVRLIKGMDGVWPGCNALARRRVLAMPRWQPAVANGKPVPSTADLSARFGALE